MTTEQMAVCETHYHLWVMLRDSQCLPNGVSDALYAIDGIYQQLGHPPARLHCMACITEMFTTVFHEYERHKAA